MTIIFATNNKHKLQEVREILGSRFSILSLQDIGFQEDIPETGTTLEENSLLKAQAILDYLRLPKSPKLPTPFAILADDTGLEIEALNNAPGVYSARYAGEPSNTALNRQKVLQEMADETNRTARFRTVITLITPLNTPLETRDPNPKPQITQLDGIVEGEILREERGEGGFGYDSIFQPKGYNYSFAEMSAEQKNAISHRGRAMQKLAELLKAPQPPKGGVETPRKDAKTLRNAKSSNLKLLIFSLLLTINYQLSTFNSHAALPMYSWQTHFAYTNVQEAELTNSGLYYGLANGALFSVDKNDGEIRTYTCLTGLNGNSIQTIRYAPQIRALLIFYTDGNIDFLYDNGNIINLPDLKNTETNLSKRVNHCFVQDKHAYLSMPFGILVLNLQKREFADTYFIGDEAQAIVVTQTIIHSDTLFAATEADTRYALLQDNLIDYHNWHILPAEHPNPFTEQRLNPNILNDYLPDGPAVNNPYSLTFSGGYLYMVAGGRWAVQYFTPANVMRYDGKLWNNLTYKQITQQTGRNALDFINVAVDPNDPEHCFATSYGMGLYEIQNQAVKRHYLPENSPLGAAAPEYPYTYTRTTGAVFDTHNHLWVANAGDVKYNILILAPDGTWAGQNIQGTDGKCITIHTPGNIIQDRFRPNYKWLPVCRYTTGLALIDDNGTPMNTADDKTLLRTSFHHNNALLAPEFVYCAAQDLDGNLWLGTSEGVFVFAYSTNFFTSDACSRPLIARTDGSVGANGSTLADYLLQSEKVKAIAIDGANRKWLGTESSGLFLMSDDGTETLEHFTTDNSPLPSNDILSLAINQETGEIFIGTGEGLLSYQSDATQSADNLEDIYAYPNPVREDYDGVITIKGLIDGCAVRIIDGGGNVVYSTTSEGGMAVWDGKYHNGKQKKRVTTGVYTIQCYAPEGGYHATTKVLVVTSR